MTQAMARFVSTGRGDATAWIAASPVTGYYGTTRKASPYVVHTVANSGASTATSSFQLKAAGVWRITAAFLNASASTLRLCRTSTANVMATSASIVAPSLAIEREFDFNATVLAQWILGGAVTTGDDANFITFAYVGPL
jgi:NAD dependent epimerase/dehydratase family enzyme